jgi:hypothetical protein
MCRASEFFPCRLEVFGTGSLDRMVLLLSVRSAKTDHQQQPFSDPARLAFSEFGLPHSILVTKRLPAHWQAIFGHLVVLLETFVDP